MLEAGKVYIQTQGSGYRVTHTDSILLVISKNPYGRGLVWVKVIRSRCDWCIGEHYEINAQGLAEYGVNELTREEQDRIMKWSV